MSFIWATRGRIWGFRFLRRGGRTDPLRDYEDAFSNAGEQPELCYRNGDRVALRFLDPGHRKDRAGRVIPHEFVLDGDLAAAVTSVEKGMQLVWPLVSAEYEQIWQQERPPAAQE